MERLFPCLDGQLAAAGAPGGDFGQIVAFRFPDCWSPRVPTGIPLRTFSRPLLETHLRHRLTALDRIRIRDGIRVTGVTGSPTHVTGVRVRIRTAATTVTPDGPTVPPDGSFRSCSPARRSERETSHCRPPPVRHRCASPRSTSVDGSAKARRSRPHPARTRSIDRSRVTSLETQRDRRQRAATMDGRRDSRWLRLVPSSIMPRRCMNVEDRKSARRRNFPIRIRHFINLREPCAAASTSSPVEMHTGASGTKWGQYDT